MYRWNDQFRSHAFQSTWGSIKAALQEEVFDASDNEAVFREVARLRKVFTYLDGNQHPVI